MGAALAVVLLLAAGPAPPVQPEPATSQATGSLVSVDAGVLTLRRGDATLQFRLDAATRLFIAAEPGTADALVTGGRVRVEYLRDQPEPRPARLVLDDRSIVIFQAERDGVAATFVGVDTKTVEEQPVTVVTVDTEHGKRRELVVRPDGEAASVILRDGEPAAPTAFTAGDRVTVALRRSGGATLFLHALADPASYLAFCADTTVEGTVAALEADGRLRLTVAGRDAPEIVRTTRRTVFFKGGAASETLPFVVGDVVVVKFRRRDQGVAVARAIFDRASWRAYAAAAAAAAPPREGGQP